MDRIATCAPPGRRAETNGAWMVTEFIAMAAAALLSGSALHGADVSRVLGVATALAGALAIATCCLRRVSIPTTVPPGGPA